MAIIVDGIHRMPLPNGQQHVVHNAVAMITYDTDGNHYRFISQLANGRGGDYEGMLTEDGDFQWVIPDTPLGKMVYTISIGDGQYSEIGELTTPGGRETEIHRDEPQRQDALIASPKKVLDVCPVVWPATAFWADGAVQYFGGR